MCKFEENILFSLTDKKQLTQFDVKSKLDKLHNFYRCIKLKFFLIDL